MGYYRIDNQLLNHQTGKDSSGYELSIVPTAYKVSQRQVGAQRSCPA